MRDLYPNLGAPARGLRKTVYVAALLAALYELAHWYRVEGYEQGWSS